MKEKSHVFKTKQLTNPTVRPATATSPCLINSFLRKQELHQRTWQSSAVSGQNRAFTLDRWVRYFFL